MSTPLSKIPLLQASGVKKSFGGNEVLSNVNFALFAGDIVLLQGANGSGKTTLLNILSGNLEPDAGSISIGQPAQSFVFPRRGINKLAPLFLHFAPEKMAWKGLGRTWQGVRLFKSLTLEENVRAAAETRRGKPGSDLLAELGAEIESRKNETPEEVSLGFAKAVAFERTLRAGAEILLLDEPLAGLDQAGRHDVLRKLKELIVSGEVKAVVVIEHDLNIPLFRGIANKVWHLADGAISESDPKHLSAPPSDPLVSWVEGLAERSERTVSTVHLPGEAVLTVASIGIASESPSSRLSIHCCNVQSSGGAKYPQSLSFNLKAGDIALLEAPNGWGKSTLLGALAGEVPLSEGAIEINAQPANRLNIWERGGAGLRYAKVADMLFNRLTVRENLSLSGIADEDIPNILKPLLAREAGSLSGGESRALAFTCAVYSSAQTIILLDEPFQAVDSTRVAVLRAALESVANQNKTILITVPVAAGMIFEQTKGKQYDQENTFGRLSPSFMLWSFMWM